MAKEGRLSNGYLEIAGINLSDHCESFTPELGQNELPHHAMGDTTVYNEPGLFTWGLQATFFQDFASGNVHATLNNMWGNKLKQTVRWRASAAAVSVTNPMWSGQAFISQYMPTGGTHGDNQKVTVTFSPSSALTVLTA